MVRRGHHAYHDMDSLTQPHVESVSEAFDDSNHFELPEQAMVNRRLESLRLNANQRPDAVPQQPQPYRSGYQPTKLVDRIPEVRLPSTLSIGGHAREPVPEIPDERRLAQDAVDIGNEGLFRTFQDTCPPPADCQYTVVDQGVSGPDVFRVSMYNVPVSAKLRESSRLPLGLYLRPFAEVEVPTADFSQLVTEDVAEYPPRCRRCRAYMNPSMQFVDGGARFVCNMCLFVNQTPSGYFQPTGADGRRIDWSERPELAYGTYELVVVPQPRGSGPGLGDELPPGSASATTSQEPLYGDFAGEKEPVHSAYGEPGKPLTRMFVVECSRDVVMKGLLKLFTEAVKDALPYMQQGERVAIMGFNSGLQLFRIRGKGPIELMVCSPGETVVPPDVFVDPVADKEAIIAFLDRLPELFEGTTDRGSCLGDALLAALTATGPGRVSALFSSLPSVGGSRLNVRDTAISGITPADGPVLKELFQPTSSYYRKLADEFRRAGCGCDLFAVPITGYLDLANLGEVARLSGGREFFYPRYLAERDSRRIIADFMGVVAEPMTATQTQLRIRCSTGLQVEVMEPELGMMDSATTVAAVLKHDGNLDPKLDVHFQAAVLYTTNKGERRVRVCNLLAGAASKIKSVLKFVDIDVVMAIMTRQALSQLGSAPAAEIRAAILNKVEDVFGAARYYTGQGMPESQLLMPTNLRELIMFGLALTKTTAVASRAFGSDARVHSRSLLRRATANALSLALYPRIYDVNNLQLTVRARFDELLLGSKAFMIFDGQQFYLWLGQTVQPSVVMAVTGYASVEEVPPVLDELPELDSNEELRQLCTDLFLRVDRSWLPLQIVRQGLDGAEYQVRALMVEDTINDSPAYLNYVSRVHEQAKEFKEHDRWF